MKVGHFPLYGKEALERMNNVLKAEENMIQKV